jgi:hypothetical protein
MTKKIVIFFKDFSSRSSVDVDLHVESCVGLNTAALAIAEVLNYKGFDVTVRPARNNVDIVEYVQASGDSLSHVVIFAPWLSAYDVKNMVEYFSEIQFVIISHSNVGFLQVDPSAAYLIRQYLSLSDVYPNLKVGGNSERFVNWLNVAYNENVIFLPNLYPISKPCRHAWDGESPLKIGVFGAVRAEKNFVTATAAVLAIYAFLGKPVEMHMTSLGGNYNILEAIDQLTKDVPGFTLVQHGWMFHEQFMELIEDMHLLIQPSFTESFNLVTADGIASGVPSVVSYAITWPPDSWKVDADDALGIARRGIELLMDRDAVSEGVESLKRHNHKGLHFWVAYLEGKKNFWRRTVNWFKIPYRR